MIRRLAMVASILVACLASSLVAGCAKPPVTAPTPTTPAVNPVKPSANARILSQTTFGDADKWSSIWQLAPDASLGDCFRGLHNGYWSVGGLGAAGNLLWSSRCYYSPRDVDVLPASAVVPNGLVAVGAHDTDGDGQSEVGYVTLYTPAGTLSSQLLFASDSSDVWLNAVEPVSDSILVVAGAERTPARTNPFLATIAVTASGQLEKRAQVVILTITNRRSIDLATNPAAPPGADLSLYLSSRAGGVEGAGIGPAMIHRLTVALPTLAPLSVDWSREIPGAGPTTDSGELTVFEDHLYFVGTTDDASKEPRPESGGYWSSGLAARLTLAGDLLWATVVRLSGHSDTFGAVAPTTGAVFAAGTAAEFMKTESKEYFGYGWIARLSPATGEVLSNLTFGNDGYRSAFNSAVLKETVMHCGGWTHEEMSGGPNPAWFCKVDVSNATPAGSPSSLIPARPGDTMGIPRTQGDPVSRQ